MKKESANAHYLFFNTLRLVPKGKQDNGQNITLFVANSTKNQVFIGSIGNEQISQKAKEACYLG